MLAMPFSGLGGSQFLSGSSAGMCIDILGCGLHTQGSILARLEAAAVGVGILYVRLLHQQTLEILVETVETVDIVDIIVI